MASSFKFLLLSLLAIFFISPCYSQRRFLPAALVLPVDKDPSTLQYITQVKQRIPIVPVKLTVDLGGQTFWVDCEQGFVSSSYKPARCRSLDCSVANAKNCSSCKGPTRPGCNSDTCNLPTINPVNGASTNGEVAVDVVSIQSSDGRSAGKEVSVPNFLFTCGSTSLLKGLASGIKGIAGLGKSQIALPSQFARAFVFPKRFGICLSASTKGVIYFGGEPFFLLPGLEVTKSLMYTPLINNPSSPASSEYYIDVKSIKINDKPVPINTALLSINKDGIGGTKISTTTPYTVMESSIYNAVVQAFANALSKVPRVPPVAPFTACFNSKGLGATRVGPPVPPIDLVLQSEKDFWRIFGANSVVTIREDVMCLGIVDGGKNPKTSIVIGGYQLENNFLHFDLETSRLGFSSSLFFYRTTCANFNFTTNPNVP